MQTLLSRRKAARSFFAALTLFAGPIVFAAFVACSGEAPSDEGATSSGTSALRKDNGGDPSPGPTATTTTAPTSTGPIVFHPLPANRCAARPASTPILTRPTATVFGASAAAPAPPSWVATCASPTYIVRVPQDSCPSVVRSGGSWTGHFAFPIAAPFCSYAWTGANAPTNADYVALESIAVPSAPDNETINAVCPSAVPGAAPPDCNPPSIDPSHRDGGGKPQDMSSCDVCARAVQDTLYVTLRPEDFGKYVIAKANGISVEFLAPSTPLFMVAIPPGTFPPDAVITIEIPRF